jgi:hypothetical protein
MINIVNRDVHKPTSFHSEGAPLDPENPAFPIVHPDGGFSIGLTVREYMALAFATTLVGASPVERSSDWAIARACDLADTLIAELNRGRA